MDNQRFSNNSVPKKRLGFAGGQINGANQWLETGLGKVPPQSLDMEEAVLGAIMVEKDALTQVIDSLSPQSFYKDSHQRIYRAILALFANSDPVDLLTVKAQLVKNGELEMAGGAIYLAQLTERVSSAANIIFHSSIIIQNSIKRELIKISSDIGKDAFEDTSDAFELLDRANQAIYAATDQSVRKSYADMGSLMAMALEELKLKGGQKDGLTGVPSGFSSLDRLTSGWQKTELVIIAARPGMGKTAFVVSALRNAAIDFNHPVAIFSLEMSSVQLVNRLISAEAELESEKIRKGTLTLAEWEQLHKRIKRLTVAPIFIDDTPALSILELRAKCRRLKQQHDIQLIVIDYLQLMQGDSGNGKTGNREQEIASISRALKNLAKELNVPVIALSQLSRSVETRGGDKKPQLSDLRESGSIEQDADMVMFLYRPEYYGLTEDDNGNSIVGVGEVIIAKNRSGSLDTIQLRFIGKFTKFTDLDGVSFTTDEGSTLTSFETATNALEDFEGSSKAVTFSSKMNTSKVDTPTPASNFGYSDPNADVPF